MPTAQELTKLPLYKIAALIRQDWKNLSPHAKPYLEAMEELSSIKDKYYSDSGTSVVAYFLANAQSWKGDLAKLVKVELNKRFKDKTDSINESVKPVNKISTNRLIEMIEKATGKKIVLV